MQENVFDEPEAKVSIRDADTSDMETTDTRTLRTGDLCSTNKGMRFRVQKPIPGGLRIRTTETGAEDFTWNQLEELQPHLLKRDESGPAARRLGELLQELDKYGIPHHERISTREAEKALGAYFAKKDKADCLDQIEPQLASDAKDLQDYAAPKPWCSDKMDKFWNSTIWAAEEKLDGVRLKLHLTPTGGRVDSRRRDTKTRRFSEKSANFPHIRALNIPKLYGTVLDSEAMLPVTSGVSPISGKPFHGSLSISTACTNAGPESAACIQKAFGPMQVYAFDVLKVQGTDVTHLPANQRRELLIKVIERIHAIQPETAEWLQVTIQETSPAKKLAFFEQITATGGEGIILKDMTAPYYEGKRAKSWKKLKRFQEIDAYVSGYIPGKSGFAGLVGALELSVMINGQEIGLAAVSQIELEERKSLTATDGSLKQEIYGRVITFRGQELTRRGRFRHAVFVSWREDKDVEDCNGYELITELKQLKMI